MGVLAHEVLHNVLGHIERRRERNLVKWNIAIDHATNLPCSRWVSLPDPKCCDPRYKGMTAESIYDILPEDCTSNWTNTWSMDFTKERLVPNMKLLMILHHWS